jgi:hypothetical protein
MPPKNTGQSVDITRQNRKERRRFSKGANLGFMIPGRHLPYVKKQHGEITDFYALRDKEIEQETKERQAQERAATKNRSDLSLS